MPYTGISDPKLPDHIKKLSAEKRKQWVGAFNGAFESCKKRGADDCEGRAFRIANAAIKGVNMEEGTIKEEQTKETCSHGTAIGEKCIACETGATSFEELDVMAVAQEKADEVMQTTYITEGLIGNVLRSDTIALEDKPNALQKVLTGFMARVKKITGSKEEGEKQVTKTEEGIKFRASDYAVVSDPEKPTTWKLRLAEKKSGDFTVAQVAMAITAMQPGGFRGQKVELEAGDKKQAVSRINAVIGKLDADDTQKENLRKRLGRVKSSAFYMTKDANGDMRWFATVSNNFRDWDNPPEILETKAHKEFVEYLDGGGRYPELWLWHTPGTKIGKADWADFSDGFLMMSGTIDKEMEYAAENLAKEPEGEVSHGYKDFNYSDFGKRIIGRYRTFEVSPLPMSKAANPWTSLEILSREEKDMNAEKRAWLARILGEEKVADIESNNMDMGKALRAAGIEYKEGGDGPEPLPQQSSAKEIAEALIETDGFKAIQGTLAEVKAYADQVPSIITRLDKLEKSDDEKIAGILTAKVEVKDKGFRASESKATEVKDGDLQDAKPTTGWPDDWFSRVVESAIPGATPGPPA